MKQSRAVMVKEITKKSLSNLYRQPDLKQIILGDYQLIQNVHN